MKDWKAVRLSPEKPLELYDLVKDPAEENDVAADHPKVVEKIAEYLKSARTESNHWPLRSAESKE